jgi:hypothetical protein
MSSSKRGGTAEAASFHANQLERPLREVDRQFPEVSKRMMIDTKRASIWLQKKRVKRYTIAGCGGVF